MRVPPSVVSTLILCLAGADGLRSQAVAPTSRPATESRPDPQAAAARAESVEVFGIAAAAVAKITGTAVFLQGRTPQSVLDVEFAPVDAYGKMIHPVAKTTVDREARTVTTDVLGVQRTAVYRDGLGCALVLDGVLPAGSLDASSLRTTHRAEDAWPSGEAGADVPRPERVDEAALTAAVEQAFVGFAPPTSPVTRAVLVVFRGKIVAERYAEGFGRDTPLHGWSMSKSITDALIGIRVGQGALTLDQPTEFAPWIDASDQRAFLTVDQLLRMSSGLEWEEDYDSITGDPIRMLFAEPDAAAFAGARPIEHAPESVWEYSSGTTNLLCKILRGTFESDAEYHAFPRRALFDRIGMRHAVLETDATGTFVGSSFGYASARDWARFGLLYLHDGVWEGERILPEGWVAASTTPTAGAPKGCYGRHWWLNRGDPVDPSHRSYPEVPVDAFYASGHESQSVTIIPSLDAVIVRLGCTKAWQTFRDRKFLRAIVAALPDGGGD